MGIYLNPGNEKFNMSLRSEIYVDKSLIISEISKLIRTEQRFICISRPRRFGKSMTANMLTAYYGKGVDSSSLFDSLAISQTPGYKEHMNNYNVLALNMQNFLTESGDISNFIPFLQEKISAELEIYYPQVTDNYDSLSNLLEKIYVATGDCFIFIIDEWDCVLRENKDSEAYQREYLEFLRNLLKDRVYVALAYMTGILPIKKYGTHSALNMFTEISMTNPGKYASYVGFTEDEVKKLCEDSGTDFTKLAYWYDGYSFAPNIHCYNPKSVTDCIINQKYASYWVEAETYEALRIYIDMNYDGLREAISHMLAGENIKINTRHFQNDMTSFENKDDVLTLLIHLGYLSYEEESGTVYIPNQEIRIEFENAIEGSHWNEVIESLHNSEQLLQATLCGDATTVSRLIEECHQNNTSILNYNDENALSYIISLAYYSARGEYSLVREFPSGKGFADIVFIPKKSSSKPAILVELKWDKDANSAIRQIKEKEYAGVLSDRQSHTILVGVNYNKKTKRHECVIENM